MNFRNIAVFAFLSFPFINLCAQNKKLTYTDKWKKIDSLITKKGLTQSALQEVSNIYISAKKEKNDAQVIKALLYRMNLQQAKQEDAEKNSINELDKEMKTVSDPAKSILTSILAESYWTYFQQNRWKFYDRTATVNFRKDDINTWGIDDFHKRISELYLSSVRNEKALKHTKLGDFDPIIIKGNVRYLRPTLFDLLTHRALEYFKNDERDITKPAYAFEIDDPVVFADKNVFAGYHFKTSDSSSLHFKALQMFQQLIAFHINDPKPDALIDADIERLVFANQYAVMDSSNELYFKSLENITDQYPNEPTAAQAWYLQAVKYSHKAERYNALTDTSNRFAYLQAMQICEKVITQKDSSEGKANCQNLLNQILHKELSMQLEKVNIPGLPFRTLISYRNFTKLYFRIVKANHATEKNLGNQWQDGYWKKITQLSSFKTFQQSFPETSDCQKHSAEIKIDSLPVGEYALLASVDENFSLQKNPMAVAFFYVSNIAYINNNNDYFVLNRETGQPQARTSVQAWYQYYDSRYSKYLERKGENFSTDKNGFFTITAPKTNNHNELKLEFTTANDHLFLDDNIDQYAYRNEEEETSVTKSEYEENNLKTFFFTDRSIYRPGQTVYFKGIVITKDFDSKQPKILPQFKTKVILYDVNDQEIDSVSVTTNDFGSYNGKFKLPENLLNGEFRIADDSTVSDQNFSVEEYKRPKFYVEYEKLRGTYRINDSIEITGSAKAYSGNNINDAIVKYRVVRQARYPYPWLYWRWGTPASTSQEIAHGEIKANADGKFFIRFAAIPDRSIKKELDPVFEYSVTADVTDINGETRSGETEVSIGYKALNLSISLPYGDNIPAGSLKNIFIKTANLSGEFEPAKVNVSIYKLKSPDRLIRRRYWQQPDQFVMSSEEYLKYFPNDEYSNETKKETWEREQKVFERTNSTNENSFFTIDHSPFTSGWYIIEVSAKDKYGEDVKNIQYVQLYDAKTGSPVNPQYNWVSDDYQITEPGKKVSVNVGSSAKDVFVIEEVASRQSPVDSSGSFIDHPLSNTYSFLQLNDEKKSTEFNIAERDRGGFSVFYAFVKNNRFYVSSNTVSVPWTNKELNISYETFRDKTLPGSEEKWKIKISGYKKDKVVAEVLSGMYDASLDQFKKQSWSEPDIYFANYIDNEWTGLSGFLATSSVEQFVNDDNIQGFYKRYDEIVLNQYWVATRHMKLAEPLMKVVPDFQNNPDGSKGLMKDAAPATQMLAGKALGVQINQVSFTPPRIITEEKVRAQEKNKTAQTEIQIRKNFNETAFFFPDLKTDSSGDVEFSFPMPEALTQWKWMILAHTKDLSFGYSERSVITQKELMVQPNVPRFLREGDQIYLTTKIVNLTDSEFTGQVQLELFDATTNQSVDGWFQNVQPNQYFTVAAKQSEPVTFSLQIPYQFNKPVTYRIIARSNQLSDGEENTLPVLSNRMLVTESLPLNMNGTGKKDFKFEKLLLSGNSETLNNHSLTVEYTSNPAWYAVQALPYLMEYPYECAEQTFNRFYANALASKIVSSSPRMKEIFERWKAADTSALLSNLQKNEEQKSILLQETPWVLQGKSESEQKKNIVLLFDMLKMGAALESALSKLQQMQLENGGFVWFKGGPDDRYITQYILTGIGHLKKLNAIPKSSTEKIDAIVKTALAYLDNKIKEDHDYLLNQKVNPASNHLGYIQIQYLYMRSFFSDYDIPGNIFPAVSYYRKQSQQYWLQQNKYMQGMVALALFRTGDVQKAKEILSSLKQNAITNEEMGMYWKENSGGYYWQQAPIETQSLLIEAFSEIGKDDKTVNSLKTWLLKQKQTENWETTKATADACYALLLQGADWLNENKNVEIRLGNTVISSTGNETEAGTGYFKKTIDGNFVKPDMGNISVSISQSTSQPINSLSSGAVYWQYFEDLDKITPASTPLQLTKKIFIEKNTDHRPELEPVLDNGTLKIGDKVKVRIELKVDRDMEYVHMKDMRASCMEPVNVLSEYKWQGGLGYYETTKDASANFFFSWLPKGTYVFEYPLFVTNTGNFSNGITTIQCMYAPEFTSHSEGIRINVE
jgi:hypothetical protein